MNNRLAPRAYVFSLPKKMTDTDSIVINSSWLIELEKELMQWSSGALNQHVGQAATYRYKARLMDSLKQCYLILSPSHDLLQLSAEQKNGIKLKLNEGIAFCSEGFHNRVDEILDTIYNPKTIIELLSKMRMELVSRAARMVTSEVHSFNRIFAMAKSMNYGVEMINAEDHYAGMANEASFRLKATQALKSVFDDHYQPLSILKEIKNYLMFRFNYQGKNLNGYKLSDYELGLATLSSFLDSQQQNAEKVLIMNEDDMIIDLDWDYILSAIWDKLCLDFFKLGHEESQVIRKVLQDPCSSAKKNSWLGLFSAFFESESLIFTSCFEVVCYLEIIGYKNISDTQRINIILDYLVFNALNIEMVNFFWDYAAHQSLAFAHLFGRHFIDSHQTLWASDQAKLFEQLSRGKYIEGLMLKSNFLPKNKKIDLFFNKFDNKNNNGLMLIAKHHVKFLSRLMSLVPASDILSLLKKKEAAKFSDVLLKLFPYDFVDNIITAYGVELFDTYGEINFSKYLEFNLLDNIFSKNKISAQMMKNQHGAYKIILGAFLHLSIVDLSVMYLLSDRVLIRCFFTLMMLVNMCFFRPFFIHFYHYFKNENLSNLTLLADILPMFFNENSALGTLKKHWDLPIDIVEKEEGLQTGATRLALSLLKSSIKNSWNLDCPAKTLTTQLEADLAKELNNYHRSNQQPQMQRQFKSNWMARCNQAKTSINQAVVLNSKEVTIYGFILALLASGHPFIIVTLALPVFFAHSLFRTQGNRLCFFPTATGEHIAHLKQSITLAFPEPTLAHSSGPS